MPNGVMSLHCLSQLLRMKLGVIVTFSEETRLSVDIECIRETLIITGLDSVLPTSGNPWNWQLHLLARGDNLTKAFILIVLLC